MKIHRRTVVALGLTAVLAGSLAACGQTTAQTPAASSSSGATPQTRVITSGGHRLAFHITPGHQPAIVLDSGGGEDSSQWSKIAPVLSRATGSEIITYDRAGMGDSDEVPGPWHVKNAVSDLKAGLTALGATHDVILVAHSQAGEIATDFTAANPGWVSGAVLVDAGLPNFYTDAETARIIAATAPQIAALKAKPSLTKAERQLIATAADFAPEHHAYHRMSWPKAVPATVLASTATPFEGSAPDARRWRQAQVDFAAEASNRSLVVAMSSHEIPTDQAAVVITQIEKMVQDCPR